MTAVHSFISTPSGTARTGGQDAVLQAIDELATAIGDARIRVECGENVDLSGLDEQVRQICAAIGQLEGSTARASLPALTGLTEGLDVLEAVLKRQHQTGTIPSRNEPSLPPRRAADAYSRRAARSGSGQ